MAKKTTAFFCKECGYESSKWLGQCPECKQWNCFVEEMIVKKQSGVAMGGILHADVVPSMINDISIDDEKRTKTGYEELDRVLGGGIVRGSLVLIGGDPGIGKSTLLLQVCRNISENNNVLYISGEESLRQIKLRADRIGDFSDKLSLLCETNLDVIDNVIRKNMPDIVVIDSIQTMYREDVASAPGSISQVRESTNLLMQIAKGLNISVFIVGHVTKEGVVAGPRILEHMVDTVLYFEGDKNAAYRIIRAVKNRFGSTNEIGVFEMIESGLRQVNNPSEYMLDGRPDNASGSVVACLMEGTRPMLVEIQALVCQTNFGMPRRTAAGVDINRFNLLMAVLEKRIGMKLSGCDAYLNIAGGLKINEPALDLAIISAIISSYKNISINHNTIVFGEVGLAGEVRSVSHAPARVNEAVKLGFNNCIVPQVCLKTIKAPENINLIGINTVNELLNYL